MTPARGPWIGTSGYQYDDWRGVLYPPSLPRTAWLAHYARHFTTVEINATFYRLPDRSVVARWRDQVPEDFLFSVKLGRYGSHRKHLRDPDDWLPRFLDVLAPLGTALGPILVQLPPRWHADPDRLARFLEAAPRDRRFAIEVRERSWLREPVFRLLRDHRAALCVHDLVVRHPRVVTSDWTYLRFHGPRLDAPYVGGYSGRALAGAARRIRRHVSEGRDVFAYFNNDIGGHAVRDALRLRRMVGDLTRPTS